MLTLTNIVKTDKIIEADYSPENSGKTAHVSIDLTNDKENATALDEFGTMYSRMAINGLRRTLKELEKGEIAEVPKNRKVMWY